MAVLDEFIFHYQYKSTGASMSVYEHLEQRFGLWATLLPGLELSVGTQ